MDGIVVVSGGGTGIGKAVVGTFARAGRRVVIIGRREGVLGRRGSRDRRSGSYGAATAQAIQVNGGALPGRG
jgi:NAD(P)-dependent dehydrogenase (short-subunit alcohol dehydrogenase family)